MGHNASFSESCNRGAAACAGELLLFLNNDIEPLEPGWLKRLVTSLDASGAAAAGAVLVDPAMTSASGSAAAVHHRAIVFRPRRASASSSPVPRARVLDVPRWVEPDRRGGRGHGCVPCWSGARPSNPSSASARTTRYGKEDVDLCLKLVRSRACRRREWLHRAGCTGAVPRAATSPFGSAAAHGTTTCAPHRALGTLVCAASTRADVETGAGVWSDGGAAGPAGVTYRVMTGAAGAEAGEAFAAALRAAGRTAAVVDDGLAWLMDDVIVHLGAPPARTVAGRVNVLVTPEPERLARRDRLRFMTVCGDAGGAAPVAEAVEADRPRGGAPGRVSAPAARGGPAAGHPRARHGAHRHVGHHQASQPVRDRGGA